MPAAKIEGTINNYVTVSDGVLHLNAEHPTITVTVKGVKTIDAKKYDVELSGGNGSGGYPTLNLLNSSGTLLSGGEMSLSDMGSLNSLKKMLLTGEPREVKLTFECPDLTKQDRSEIAKNVSKMAFRCDINLTPKPIAGYYGAGSQRALTKGAPASSVRIKGVHVRLRWTPSYSGTIYANGYGVPIYPSNGEVLTCTGTYGDWYQVLYNGNTLYVSRYYATPASY